MNKPTGWNAGEWVVGARERTDQEITTVNNVTYNRAATHQVQQVQEHVALMVHQP